MYATNVVSSRNDPLFSCYEQLLGIPLYTPLKISRYQNLKVIFIMIFIMLSGPLLENTRQRSDAFAAQNGLPKFEYVLHPRTTGFTFIVDRLRKGEDVSHYAVGYRLCYLDGNMSSAWAQENDTLVPNPPMLVDPVFFNTQTCVSCCCQPLLHLRESLVSVWANVGSPPGFLPYPCTPPHPAAALQAGVVNHCDVIGLC